MNEQKVRDLCMAIEPPYIDFIQQNYKTALQAMQWKDEQFAKEKQQWIDKACEFIKIYTHTRNEGATHCVVSSGETQDDFIEKFKKAMEDEL